MTRDEGFERKWSNFYEEHRGRMDDQTPLAVAGQFWNAAWEDALLEAAKAVCEGCRNGLELRKNLRPVQESTMRHYDPDGTCDSHCGAEAIHRLRESGRGR